MITYILKSNSLYKIGRTEDLQSRLVAYNTHCPGYELVKILQGDVEQILHKIFKDKRVQGEWFALDDSEISELDHTIENLPRHVRWKHHELKPVTELGYFYTIQYPGPELSHSEFRILIGLNLYTETNTNRFFLNSKRRIELSDMCNMKLSTVNIGISGLQKKGYLLKLAAGLYVINPNYYYKGDTNLLKYAIEEYDVLMDRKVHEEPKEKETQTHQGRDNEKESNYRVEEKEIAGR